MKRNSGIPFHCMKKALKNGYYGLIFLLGAVIAQGAPLEGYDPETGFAPAQNDLTKVFLKLAASLEVEGTPEVYIRHVLEEHARIDAKYEKATGKKGSARPEYFTDAYMDNLLTNWKRLEEPLQLEQLCRDSGRHMRHAILGSWHKTPNDLLLEEENLTDAEKKQYRDLLSKAFFVKSDFSAMESFYADGGGYDKLSQSGREQMSLRTHLGTLSPEKREKYFDDYAGGTTIVGILNEYQRLLVADINADGERKVNSEKLEKLLVERLSLNGESPEISELERDEKDAVTYSHMVKWEFDRRFNFSIEKLGKKDGENVNDQIFSMVENLLILAHSELRGAMKESFLERTR